MDALLAVTSSFPIDFLGECRLSIEIRGRGHPADRFNLTASRTRKNEVRHLIVTEGSPPASLRVSNRHTTIKVRAMSVTA